MHKRTMKRRILWGAAFVLWVAFIFWNSLHDGASSAKVSGGALDMLNQMLEGLHIQWRPSEHFLRKAAHFLEYMALGMIAFMLARALAPVRWAKMAQLLAFIVPPLDEGLQTFIPGRAGQFADVLLDWSGALAGCALLALAFYVGRKVAGRRPAPRKGHDAP